MPLQSGMPGARAFKKKGFTTAGRVKLQNVQPFTMPDQSNTLDLPTLGDCNWKKGAIIQQVHTRSVLYPRIKRIKFNHTRKHQNRLSITPLCKGNLTSHGCLLQEKMKEHLNPHALFKGTPKPITHNCPFKDSAKRHLIGSQRLL